MTACCTPRTRPAAPVVGEDQSLMLPIIVQDELAAFLQVGVHEGAIRSELAELRLDIGTVFLATLLVGIELLVAFVVVRVSGPIQLADRLIVLSAKGDFLRRIELRNKDEIGAFAGAYNDAVHRVNSEFAMLTEEAEDARAVQLDRTVQQRIRDVVTALGMRFRFTLPGSEETIVPRSPMDVRIPLFLFMLAQELSRPFLPLFFDQLYTPIGMLSQELTIGLPITTFMVMVLIAIPIGGALTDRIAPRAMFVMGIVPSVAGHVGAALSGSIAEVLVWWTLAGLGYGMIFISAQAYVAHHTVQSSRAVGSVRLPGGRVRRLRVRSRDRGDSGRPPGLPADPAGGSRSGAVLRRRGTGDRRSGNRPRCHRGFPRQETCQPQLAPPPGAARFRRAYPVLRVPDQAGARRPVLLSGSAVPGRSGQLPVQRRPHHDGVRHCLRRRHPPSPRAAPTAWNGRAR